MASKPTPSPEDRCHDSPLFFEPPARSPAWRPSLKVSLIEPGNYRSEIGRDTVAQVEAAVARNPNSPFQQQMRNMVTAMGSYDNDPEPDSVAAAAVHALFDPNPKMRYLVVPVARQAEVTIRKAIDEVVQLNQRHPFS